jgi:excisionase family DNA binding protein
MPQLAERWELSRETIRKRIKKGDIQARKFGRAVRISIGEVERLEAFGWT